MKYIASILLAFTFFSCTAQSDKDKEEVKGVIHDILDLCKATNDEKLAPLVVYRGEDSQRKWKDICNPQDEEDMQRVKSVRTRLQQKLLPYTYEFTKFISEKESEGRWYVWELKVNNNKERNKVYLAFLKINGKFALGDID